MLPQQLYVEELQIRIPLNLKYYDLGQGHFTRKVKDFQCDYGFKIRKKKIQASYKFLAPDNFRLNRVSIQSQSLVLITFV